MIKISESLKSTSDNFMSTLVEEYWNNLNIKNSNNENNKYSLTYKLDQLIEEYSEKKHFLEVSNNDNKLHSIQLNFLKYLSNDNYKNLILCIKGLPHELESISLDVFNNFGISIFEEKKPDGSLGSTSFSNLLIKRIFNYTTFRSSPKCVALYKKLDLEGKYCPYCNSNQFEVISDVVPTKNNHISDCGLLLFDLDHFFLKYKHPFLALAFYNLIPCCPICNSRVRGSTNFTLETHINPYSHSFHDHFEFNISKDEILKSLFNKKLTKFNLNINKKASSLRLHDISQCEFKIDKKVKTKVYEDDVKNVADTFIKYHNRNHEQYMDNVHGLNEQHIPSSSKSISNIQRGKLKLDILNLYRTTKRLPKLL